MPTPAYRYVLTDLRTDQVLATLPLSGVKFGRRISRVGALSATLDASSPELVRLAKVAYANAGRAALWVYRDAALWWGGILWTVQPQQGPRGSVQVSLQAATFDSYAHRRVLPDNGSPAWTFTQVDQATIIANLWISIQNKLFSGDGGSIGVDTSMVAATGVLRDRTYPVGDMAPVGKLIEDLGDVDGGPEHTIDLWTDETGARRKVLRVANRLGVSEPRVVFQRTVSGGGRVVEWQRSADAVDGGTHFRTRGDAASGNAGADAAPLLSSWVARDDLIAAGWPRLDVTEDHAGTTELATLDTYATAMSTVRAGAMPTVGYTVEVGDSGWSPNQLGDSVRFKLTDAWHEDTDMVVRPVGCDVTPPTKTSPEQVDLLLSED